MWVVSAPPLHHSVCRAAAGARAHARTHPGARLSCQTPVLCGARNAQPLKASCAPLLPRFPGQAEPKNEVEALSTVLVWAGGREVGG